MEDKGNIEDYLGVNIKEKENGKIKLTQPQIIDSIINNVQLPKNTTPRHTPNFFHKDSELGRRLPSFQQALQLSCRCGKAQLP